MWRCWADSILHQRPGEVMRYRWTAVTLLSWWKSVERRGGTDKKVLYCNYMFANYMKNIIYSAVQFLYFAVECQHFQTFLFINCNNPGRFLYAQGDLIIIQSVWRDMKNQTKPRRTVATSPRHLKKPYCKATWLLKVFGFRWGCLPKIML